MICRSVSEKSFLIPTFFTKSEMENVYIKKNALDFKANGCFILPKHGMKFLPSLRHICTRILEIFWSFGDIFVITALEILYFEKNAIDSSVVVCLIILGYFLKFY